MQGPALAVALTLLGAAAARADAIEQDPALARYEGRAIVTGTDNREKPRGYTATFLDVLVKASGDPTLLDDPRAKALAAQAPSFATGLDYYDRMSGIKHHDQQGSEDRPFNMTVRYDPAKIDVALKQLGRAPWPDPRPSLAMRLHVRRSSDAFDLTQTEPRGEGMRKAITMAAQKYGVIVNLPPGNGEVALQGDLVLDPAALGWVCTWHVAWRGQDAAWTVSGVNFDEAFRRGISGAMQLLSGHGAPQ
jgi:hypothetical protein